MELVPATFDPLQLLNETSHLLSSTATGKGLTLTTEWTGPTDVRYRSDPVRVRQMLNNLIGNAIKFTDAGTVQVYGQEMSRTPNDHGTAQARLRFTVIDTGIGISAEQQSLLFKPFSMVDDSNTRRHGGSGLGLSIVHSLAELLGGATGVQSQQGEGSAFWFEITADVLPRQHEQRSSTRDAVAPQPESAPSTCGHVLVVEDNLTNRRVAELVLKKAGYTTVHAEDGESGVAVYEREHQALDLILMDMQMPIMDGLEATRQIRQRESSSGRTRIPIIALTANTFDKDRDSCLAAGMDDFLSKPMNADLLIRTVKRWQSQSQGVQ
jgi:CheY-like chemotaxis protein